MISVMKWLGNAFLIAGLWKLGDGWRHAYWLTILGEVCYIVVSLNDFPLAFICGLFAVVSFRNWYIWRDNG